MGYSILDYVVIGIVFGGLWVSALKGKTSHIVKFGDNLVIWFEYEDITGAYQGDGEYAAIISIK